MHACASTCFLLRLQKRQPVGGRVALAAAPFVTNDHLITAWRPCLSLMTMVKDLCVNICSHRTSTSASSHLPPCLVLAAVRRRSTLVLPCDSISSPITNPCLEIRRTRRVDPQSHFSPESRPCRRLVLSPCFTYSVAPAASSSTSDLALCGLDSSLSGLP